MRSSAGPVVNPGAPDTSDDSRRIEFAKQWIFRGRLKSAAESMRSAEGTLSVADLTPNFIHVE